ncbi:MAG: phosphonate C-P lyase system protein PhnG [Desulfovibrio sp.]|jgi:alpha-D-ribose 1-methylphosphonate 5-triphosphate synthase subunit PhnG|nr:phosphonate C-P lyase system protein PhnG [Desulfovibrio sp.]
MRSQQPAEQGLAGKDRQRWMRAFALGDEAALAKGLAVFPACPPYTFLRKPEAGMLMLEGRAGNAGRRFNFGEMLVTRCAVRMATADGEVSGHAYVAGNRPRHAEAAAVLDAMMQQPEYAERLDRELVAPLLAAWELACRETAAETAKTRVDFFTMARGEDA